MSHALCAELGVQSARCPDSSQIQCLESFDGGLHAAHQVSESGLKDQNLLIVRLANRSVVNELAALLESA